jgi:hypothetical protein
MAVMATFRLTQQLFSIELSRAGFTRGFGAGFVLVRAAKQARVIRRDLLVGVAKY